MKQWVKIVLGIGVVVILGFVGISFVVYRWFKGTIAETTALAPAASQAGSEFAKHSTQDGCIDEATRRVSECASLACEVAEKGFLDSCFHAATPDTSACTGVPKADKIMDTATWQVAECKRRGHPTQRCQRLLSDVQRLCGP